MQKYLKPEQSLEREHAVLPRLSRSPHPYTRRSFRFDRPATWKQDLNEAVDIDGKHNVTSGCDTTNEGDSLQGQSIPRQSSEAASSSDAEEEQLLLLKALPPPSIKASKGLRIPPFTVGQHDNTPLLTPNALHEAQDLLAKGYFAVGTGSSISQDELEKLRARIETKRRLGLIHRACEVLLLVVITLVVLNGEGVWGHACRWSRGE